MFSVEIWQRAVCFGTKNTGHPTRLGPHAAVTYKAAGRAVAGEKGVPLL